MKKIIIILLLLSSCDEYVYQDDRLTPFINEVHQNLENKNVIIDHNYSWIIKKDLNSSHSAYGYSSGNSIYIDESTFNEFKETKPYRILGLIAHEIGHNRLGLHHIESQYYTDSLNRPIIMRTGTWQYINENNIDLMFDRLVEDFNN